MCLLANPVNSVSQQDVKHEKALKMEMDQTSQLGAASSSSLTQDLWPEFFLRQKTEESSPPGKNMQL